ncbi:MAG: cell division protein SepF [Candidatus Thermoplasmatota archaeon]
MTTGIVKRRPFKRAKEGRVEDHYLDLGEMRFEGGPVGTGAPGGAAVGVAEIDGYENLGNLTENLYAGNILVLDYESIANDEPVLKRIIADLKSVARDTGGDVAGIGKHMLVATPSGIAIDRNKIRGSY